MNGRLLIDTNIYSSALRGEQEVVTALRQVAQIYFTAISIGELLCGFKGGTREKDNYRQLGIFLDSPRVTIIAIDESTAEFYGAVLSKLKAKGTPIPTNDIWIAAAAFQHGLPLYTFDRHFAAVDGLLLVC